MNTTACIFSLTFSGTVANVDKFTFTGTTTDKYQAAIIGTVRMLGFMSLKNDDHSVTGTNAAANKRMLKDAIATRAAADALLASGAIVILGTWSNGIQVGPGEGFARIGHSAPVAAPAKKTRRNVEKAIDPKTMQIVERTAHVVTITEKMRNAPTLADAIAAKEELCTGDTCDWSPAPVFGPAYVAPLGTPPGLAITDDQDALHVWRSEMDFSYVPETFAETFAAQCHESALAIAAAPRVSSPMWIDGDALTLNPAFVASVNAYRAAHPEDTRFAPLTADDTDDEIDAMLDAIIEREEAA